MNKFKFTGLLIVLKTLFEVEMLESVEPFYSLLRVSKIFGLWDTNLLSTRHKAAALFAFLFVFVLGVILIAVNLLLTENVFEIANMDIFLLSFKNFGYVIFFWFGQQGIMKLFEDMNRIFRLHPESVSFMTIECRKTTKIEIVKFSLLTFGIISGMIVSLIVGKPALPMCQPEAMNNSFGFLITWFYTSMNMMYPAIFDSLLYGVYLNFLAVVRAHCKYFVYRLKMLDTTATDLRVKIIECVNIHRDTRM
jgi:hypothetical protein